MSICSYILALKGELAQAHVSVASVADNTRPTTGGQQMEQTILAMRRVIERLKVENKNLKDGKMFANKSGTSKVRISYIYVLTALTHFFLQGNLR